MDWPYFTIKSKKSCGLWIWRVIYYMICSYDEIKFALFILFYFIFPLYDIWFIDYDLLHSYLHVLFHLVSIVWKKEIWVYVMGKNIPVSVESHAFV